VTYLDQGLKNSRSPAHYQQLTNIPWDLIPRMLAGFKLAKTMIFFPTISSGNNRGQDRLPRFFPHHPN
jgi:hypothetical protein